MYYENKLQRGYNQTELIAREIAKKAELEYINILEKCKNTIPQSTLSKEERIENSKDIYRTKEPSKQKIKDVYFP